MLSSPTPLYPVRDTRCAPCGSGSAVWIASIGSARRVASHATREPANRLRPACTALPLSPDSVSRVAGDRGAASHAKLAERGPRPPTDNAVHDLTAARLVHRHGAFVFPSRAAVRF